MIPRLNILPCLLLIFLAACSGSNHYKRTIKPDGKLDQCKQVKEIFDRNWFDLQRPFYASDSSYQDLERLYINKQLADRVLNKFDSSDKATIKALLKNREIKQIETFGRKCVLFELRTHGLYPFSYSTTYLLFHDHRDNNTKECFFIHIYDKILFRENIDSNWIYFRGKDYWGLPEC